LGTKGSNVPVAQFSVIIIAKRVFRFVEKTVATAGKLRYMEDKRSKARSFDAGTCPGFKMRRNFLVGLILRTLSKAFIRQ
jgi:hypothetical protein